MTTAVIEVHDALLNAQKEAPALQKNAINPHFKSRYLSLDALMEQILPILNANDLVLIQEPQFEYVGNSIEPILATTLYHTPSKTSIGSSMPLMLDKETPQGQGSAITYARRYALMAILGLVADVDDDANAATPQRRNVVSKDSLNNQNHDEGSYF